MEKVTLKRMIKDLAKAKIKGKKSKYDYYCYNSHEYEQVVRFDLLRDRFECKKYWNFFDCKDKNLLLYRELKSTSEE